MDLSVFRLRRQSSSSLPLAPLSPLAIAIKDGPQFTLLGDTGHTDGHLRAFLSSDKLFEDMRKGGVRHFFMEGASGKERLTAIDQKWGKIAAEIGPIEKRTPERQNRFEKILAEALFDSLYAPGQILASANNENVNRMSKFVSALLKARAEGIAVHFPDHDDMFEKGRKADLVYSCYQTSWLKRTLSRTETLEMASLRERLAQDDRVAERIVKAAGREKSAIIYGLAHFDPQNGLCAQLQKLGKQGQLIALTTSSSAANLPTMIGQLRESGVTTSMPDRFFDVAKQDFADLPAVEAAIREAGSYRNKWSGFFCQP